MRVMVVRPGPTWSTADVAVGWVEALRALGVDVLEFGWNKVLAYHSNREPLLSSNDLALIAADSLLASVFAAAPDVVLFVHGGEVPPSAYRVLRRRGVRVVVHHTESPYEDDRIADRHWIADLHLVNDVTGLERLRALGAEAFYAPQSYRPSVHHPGAGPRDLPFVFVGSGFAGRRAFFEAMRWPAGLDPILAGHWITQDEDDPLDRYQPEWLPQPLDNEQTAALYRRAQMSLNLYRLDHLDRPELAAGWSMSPREVEMAACGLFFARMPRPEGDEVLPMLPTFTSVAEASEVLDWWWRHPQSREMAAATARAAVAGRTFEALARGTLGCLETKGLVAA
jgi:spore maturation protein CgeB